MEERWLPHLGQVRGKNDLHKVRDATSSGGIQIGGVFAYAQHVSVEFSKGASIEDPYGYLEGAGKGRRHVKLRANEDIGRKHLAAYLPLALEACRGAA